MICHKIGDPQVAAVYFLAKRATSFCYFLLEDVFRLKDKLLHHYDSDDPWLLSPKLCLPFDSIEILFEDFNQSSSSSKSMTPAPDPVTLSCFLHDLKCSYCLCFQLKYINCFQSLRFTETDCLNKSVMLQISSSDDRKTFKKASDQKVSLNGPRVCHSAGVFNSNESSQRSRSKQWWCWLQQSIKLQAIVTIERFDCLTTITDTAINSGRSGSPMHEARAVNVIQTDWATESNHWHQTWFRLIPSCSDTSKIHVACNETRPGLKREKSSDTHEKDIFSRFVLFSFPLSSSPCFRKSDSRSEKSDEPLAISPQDRTQSLESGEWSKLGKKVSSERENPQREG